MSSHRTSKRVATQFHGLRDYAGARVIRSTPTPEALEALATTPDAVILLEKVAQRLPRISINAVRGMVLRAGLVNAAIARHFATLLFYKAMALNAPAPCSPQGAQ